MLCRMGDVDGCLGIDHGRDQRIDRQPGRQVQSTLLQVAHARREAVTEERHEPEHVVGHPAGVDGVLLDREPGLMVEEPVEHVRRLACGRGDDLGVERPILIGDVGVERHARLVAMAGVHRCDRLACASGEEVLSVRTRLGAIAPQLRQRQRAMRVDQAGERLGVVGSEMCQSCARASWRRLAPRQVRAMRVNPMLMPSASTQVSRVEGSLQG